MIDWSGSLTETCIGFVVLPFIGMTLVLLRQVMAAPSRQRRYAPQAVLARPRGFGAGVGLALYVLLARVVGHLALAAWPR